LLCMPTAADKSSHPVAEAGIIVLLTSSTDILRDYNFNLIPYSSCTINRHWPRGLSLANAVWSASALLHLSLK
jgi:hypothetical protein